MKYERLTKRFTGGSPYTDIASNYDVLERLAELEDKIERGELVDTKENHLIAISRASGKSSKQLEAIDILTKYENGTLIELPCKVGDTVYYETFINNGSESVGIQPHEVKSIYTSIVTSNFSGYGHTIVELDEFGKTVFLTKAEAEAKLKELEE